LFDQCFQLTDERVALVGPSVGVCSFFHLGFLLINGEIVLAQFFFHGFGVVLQPLGYMPIHAGIHLCFVPN